MTIAESLKRFRKEFNLKQKDVAEKLGMTTQAYSFYERPNNPQIPKSNLIVKLADEYNVTTDYLLGRSDTPQIPTAAESNVIIVDSEKFYQALKLLMSSVKV